MKNRDTMRQSSRDLLYSTVICSLMFVAGAPAFAEGQQTIAVAEQDAGAALKELARQTNVNVLFTEDVVRNARTQAINGSYSAAQALRAMLAGTGLAVEEMKANTFVVRRVSLSQPAGEAASQRPFASPESGAAAGSSAGSSSGASAGHSGFAIEEIVVTAAKRSQALQDVAMSLSALDSRRLEQMGAREFNDYLRTVPGVSFIDRGSGRNKVIIRGISDGPNSSTDATTGVYIDETPITDGLFSGDANLFDVERVEVLRGPQGTLYGGGSMGGTVRTILNKPDASKFSASADSTLSGTRRGEANYAVNGMVNVPVVEDKFALRVVGSYRHDGGYVDDVIRNIDNVNEVEVKGIRIAAQFTPNDDLRILGTVMHQDTESGAFPSADIARGPFEQGRAYAENGANDWTLYSFQVNYDFGWADLVSSTSYFEKDALNRTDYSPVINPMFGLPPTVGMGLENTKKLKNFVQEMRLSSKGDGKLQWIAGLFYNDRKNRLRTYGDSSNVPMLGGIPLVDSTDRLHIEQVALFGELTYHVTDKFEVTAGARWFDVSQNAASEGIGLIINPADPLTPMTTGGKASERSQNFKLLMSYKMTADNMVYAQAAQGFRVGGPVEPLPDVCAAGLAQLGLTEAPTDYKSDKLWNYEIGSKNSFLDKRLTLNASVYYIDWTNIQVQRIIPGCGFNFIGNGPKADSKGFEVEVAFHPVEGLELSGSLAYTKTRMKQDVPNIGAIAGDPLPNVPEWTANAAATYSFPLSESYEGYLRGDVQYVDGSYNDFTGLSNGFSIFQPSYTIGNLRAGVRQDQWEVAVFVNNLWDERAQTYTQLAFANPYAIVNRPRTFGLYLKGNF